MTFQFVSTSTEQVDFRNVLPPRGDPGCLTFDYLMEANAARQRLVSALTSQPAGEATVTVIEGYLPFVMTFVDLYKGEPTMLKGKGCANAFKWRSILSLGISNSIAGNHFEKPQIECSSILFEALYVLFTLGCTLAGLANKCVAPLTITHQTPPTEACFNKAAEHLMRAGSVFRMAALLVAPLWSNAPEKRPPECTAQILTLLSQLMRADANKLALRKAISRGASPVVLVKVGVCISEEYGQCVALLGRISKRDAEELSSHFKSYVVDGFSIADASLMFRHGTIKHEEEKNGIAIACMNYSCTILQKCARGAALTNLRIVAEEMLVEVEGARSKISQINNNITYQPIASLPEARSTLPPGISIVPELTTYATPMAPHLPM